MRLEFLYKHIQEAIKNWSPDNIKNERLTQMKYCFLTSRNTK